MLDPVTVMTSPVTVAVSPSHVVAVAPVAPETNAGSSRVADTPVIRSGR